MYCKKCNKDFSDTEIIEHEDDIYCPMCGYKINIEEYYYTKDPTSLTNFLKIMLYVSIAVVVISLFVDIIQLSILADIKQLSLINPSVAQNEAELIDSIQGIVGFLSIATFIITAISYLKWVYQANLNCSGFTNEGMLFTPGWSIGYYFIPLMNLYNPFKAMKEIWNVSENPKDCHYYGNKILTLWWAFWILNGFIGFVELRTWLKINSMSYPTINDLKVFTETSIIADVFTIPLIISTIILVSAIFKKQENLIVNIA